MAVSTLPLAAAPAGRSARTVAIWLLICCAMIFAMVVIGGITRLTESGLSITEWKPVTGAIPPLNEADWRDAFEKYKQIPEYQQLKRGMTLEEFKFIYFWEWVHRLWGRLIGVAFLVPFLWFLATRRARGGLALRLGALFMLGGLQGALGWYMVQSGLSERTDVSQYRLTAHLMLAVAIYAYALWIALDLLRPRPAPSFSPTGSGWHWLAALIALTMAAGGFVAGTDAGRTYNTFPLMDGRLIPAGYLDLAPWWENLFENVAAVQFNHRWLGIATLAATLALWARSRVAVADRAARGWIDASLAAVLLQVALGIATLLLAVPIALGVLHQAGAMVLLTAVLGAAHALRRSGDAAGSR